MVAVAVLVTMAGVGLVAASLVAATLVDALVIGNASYCGAGVPAYNADEGVWTVGVAARIGAGGVEGQSARDEKTGNRSFDRCTHGRYSFCVLQLCRN